MIAEILQSLLRLGLSVILYLAVQLALMLTALLAFVLLLAGDAQINPWTWLVVAAGLALAGALSAARRRLVD